MGASGERGRGPLMGAWWRLAPTQGSRAPWRHVDVPGACRPRCPITQMWIWTVVVSVLCAPKPQEASEVSLVTVVV